jgi:hypothetical protein
VVFIPAKGYIWEFLLDCKQPDGSWKSFEQAWDRQRYNVTAEAAPGSGNLRFKYAFLQVLNDGDVAGTVFGKVVDDTGKVIWSKSQYLEPGLLLYNDTEIVFDMPNRNYTLTFQAGHGTTVDDTVKLTINLKLLSTQVFETVQAVATINSAAMIYTLILLLINYLMVRMIKMF